jgi:hypothetical protein
MKKLMLCTALFVSVAAIQTASAQVRVNVNVNIGSQPQWGPSGYDTCRIFKHITMYHPANLFISLVVTGSFLIHYLRGTEATICTGVIKW